MIFFKSVAKLYYFAQIPNKLLSFLCFFWLMYVKCSAALSFSDRLQ